MPHIILRENYQASFAPSPVKKITNLTKDSEHVHRANPLPLQSHAQPVQNMSNIDTWCIQSFWASSISQSSRSLFHPSPAMIFRINCASSLSIVSSSPRISPPMSTHAPNSSAVIFTGSHTPPQLFRCRFVQIWPFSSSFGSSPWILAPSHHLTYAEFIQYEPWPSGCYRKIPRPYRWFGRESYWA